MRQADRRRRCAGEHFTAAEAGGPLDHFRWARVGGPLAAQVAAFAAATHP